MMQNVLLYEKKLLLLSRWFHFSANMCTKIFNNHAAKREVFVQIFCIHWRELWWLKTIRYHLWRDYRNSPKSNSASASAIHEQCGDEKNPVNFVKVRISAQPLVQIIEYCAHSGYRFWILYSSGYILLAELRFWILYSCGYILIN